MDYIEKLSDESEKSHFFEVDISYPEELHDKHNTFPLRPHHKNIKPEDLSDYQLELAKKMNLKVGGQKLVTSLTTIEKYVLHQRNLKQYHDNGLKIEKVHRVLEFKQDAWLKPYIKKNTNLRTEGMEKGAQDIVDFAKLMNNSGKVNLFFFLYTHKKIFFSLWKNSGEC